MYYRGTWQELIAMLPPSERAEIAAADEREQDRRIAETWARDVLEAMEAERGTDTAT